MLEEVKQRVIKHERPDLVDRVSYLDEIIKRILKTYIPLDASILQIGCACGYILDTFKANGYTNLTGIDKDPELAKTFPEGIKFINKTAREALKELPKYDVVITHKFLYILEPLPKNDELMNTISKSFNKYLITMEEEGGIVGRVPPNIVYWNRNYKDVFSNLKQVLEHSGSIEHLVFRLFSHA